MRETIWRRPDALSNLATRLRGAVGAATLAALAGAHAAPAQTTAQPTDSAARARADSLARAKKSADSASAAKKSQATNPTKTDTRADTTRQIGAGAVPSLDSVWVRAVHRKGHPATVPADSAGIGDIVMVRVDHLMDLVRRAKCLDGTSHPVPTTACQPRDIALFLDGREIKGIVPESGAPQPEIDELQFHLQRNADSDEAWADLLGAPSRPHLLYRPTPLSVGLAGDYALASDVKEDRFALVRADPLWLLVCIALLAASVVAILWAATRTNMLRDSGADPTGTMTGRIFKKPRPKLRPYSLGRVQMAFWFVLVILSYVFIWLITGASDTVTPSVLALIGIGAGTALGAAVIDAAKTDGDAATLQSLVAEQAALPGGIKTLEDDIAQHPANEATLRQQLADLRARQNVVQSSITALQQTTAPAASDGFLADVLGHDSGTSFHRLQMLVWTLVLGVLFLHSVWGRLSMPEFSGTLLALLGISSGTYLGFKIPEK